MIVIVDYGMGNTGTIAAKIRKIDPSVLISSNVDDIEKADRLVLPGMGSFRAAMQNINTSGIISVLEKQVVQKDIPVLGICLGMQLFTCNSEEGGCQGLGWIDGRTVRFQQPDYHLRIPHMGWNTIRVQRESPLLEGIEDGSRFYFSHSYHVVCDKPDDIVAVTDYGSEFCSILSHRNISGIQFHPERSHERGLTLLSNFIRGE